MSVVFADTFYFLALLNPSDEQHTKAIEAAGDQNLFLVTAEWVLVEFGDAYCRPSDRGDFVSLYRSLTSHPRIKIVPASIGLFQRGIDYFERRPDKNWSLTDCLSFVCMEDEHIEDALTGDTYFEQAGFTALLR